MRSPFKSIRARLTLWYSFIVLTTLALFGVIAYTYSSRQLVDNLDRLLTSDAQWVSSYLTPKAGRVKPSRKFTTKQKQPIEPESIFPGEDLAAQPQDADDAFWSELYIHSLVNRRNTLIEVTDKRGNLIFRSVNSPDENLAIGEVPVNTIKIITLRTEDGAQLRVAATSTDKQNIYVAYPLAELDTVLDNLYSIFLILIPIALAVSLGGGWFLAYKSLRPVDLITSTARKITAENLDQTIPRHETNDELGRLIVTLNDMIGRLRASFERIKQFTMDASHELRTPLTIMRGEVELALANIKDPEEYRRVLVSNLEENLRLAAIIDNLLTLSKADLGQHEVALEPLHLAPLLDELFEDSEIIAMKKNITIVLNKHGDATVRGDKLRLRQLFLNLIENAVKFTPPGGKVTLFLERTSTGAVVLVSDTGVGIPKEEQAKIFDRFYRVDKARSRELGGSGLGLSIAKWIAEMHGGSITLESEVGKGTTFIVTLPAELEVRSEGEVVMR